MSLFRPDQIKKIESIKLERLTVTGESGTNLINDLTLELPMKKIVWLKGDHSKSILLKVLAGLQTPTSGHYFMNGSDVYEWSFEEFLPYRLNIGYTFPIGGILSNRTLRENIMLPFQYHGVPVEIAKPVVDEFIKMFAMETFEKNRPFGVPGIYRKLTCLIRALATGPEVLFLDDPSSALGHRNIDSLRNWLKSRKEMSVFIASDDEELFRGLDHEVIIINEGRYLDTPMKVSKAVGE